MPIISNFYGISIKMYFQQDEHNPPHIHALYGEYMGVINIKTGELLEGDLPKRALKLVQEWLNVHKKEIIKIWNTQKFKKIPPLK